MKLSFGLNLLATREPAECVLSIEGESLDDFYPLLEEVTVETGRNAPDTARLTFESRRDELGDWLVQDAKGLSGRVLFQEWNQITVSAAFGTNKEEILRGFIRQVRTEYPNDPGAVKVIIEVQDESFQLDRQQRRQSWGTTDVPVTDQQILQEVVGRYSGLSPVPGCGSGQSGIVGENQNGTDIQWLKKRAEENGYELIFREGSVYFGPMRTALDQPQPTILVYAGSDSNCVALNVSSDAHQPDKVFFDLPADTGAGSRKVSIDPNMPHLGKKWAGNPKSGLVPFEWRMSGESGNGAANNETRLSEKARAKANDADMHRIQAEGELDGTLYGHVLRPGLPVGVDGIGSRQSGLYYVDTVSHVFNSQGYRQRFKLLRNAWGDNLDNLPGAGPLAAVLGFAGALSGGFRL
ncbi:MAG: hypothetical protein KAY13_01130 [Zoogloea sp.]|nr:hypothetical protein [Zoogloea sp.]